MRASGGGVFKAEGRANAKALRQGTALARLRTGSRKGIKKGSSRKRMRAVTGRKVDRGGFGLRKEGFTYQ